MNKLQKMDKLEKKPQKNQKMDILENTHQKIQNK